MKAEKEIIIDGDKFRATRLLPNYRGEYTCKCEECHLSLDVEQCNDVIRIFTKVYQDLKR